MEQLEGRVAVITGAGSGIGEALARATARAGMKVVAADIEIDEVNRVAASLEDTGADCVAIETDVADRDAVEKLASEAYDRFGAVHLLCNNAGVLVYEPVNAASLDDWEWVLSVNLYGVIHGVQAFVPRMRAQDDKAHIVNTGSISGLAPTPRPAVIPAGPYIASKYAVVGLSEVLRDELASEGIGVSVLCPGGVVTRIGEAARNRPQRLGGPVAVSLPPRSGRSGQVRRDPEDVAELVLDGVRKNHLYIHTDVGMRKFVEERFEQILEGFEYVK